MRLTNMIAYTSTMMDALRPARISERGINSVSPFRAPSNQVHIHDHNRGPRQVDAEWFRSRSHTHQPGCFFHYAFIPYAGSGRLDPLTGYLGNSLITLTKSSIAQQGRVCTVTIPRAVAQPALFSAATSFG